MRRVGRLPVIGPIVLAGLLVAGWAVFAAMGGDTKLGHYAAGDPAAPCWTSRQAASWWRPNWRATVGQPSAQLGEMIEALHEAADAGRGRAQLDDEVLHLGGRHLGADLVPARPAGARVGAGDLAAAAREDGVDAGIGLARAEDRHLHHRLEQHGRGLGHALDHGEPRRLLEGHVR